MFEIFFISFQLCFRINPFFSAGEGVYLLLLCFCVQLRRQKDKNCQQCGIPALFSLDKAPTKTFCLFLEWGWIVLVNSWKGSYQSSGQKELCQWLQQQHEQLIGLNLQMLKWTNRQREISGGKVPRIGITSHCKADTSFTLWSRKVCREPGWLRVSGKSEE